MEQDVTRETAAHAFVKAVHGVRYQVRDVDRATRVLDTIPRVHAQTAAPPRVRERRAR